jgi:hypothetical protein
MFRRKLLHCELGHLEHPEDAHDTQEPESFGAPQR